MKYVKRKVINFLRPDGLWDSEVFERILSFCKKYPNINFFAGGMKFFGAKNNCRILDFKLVKLEL